MDTDVRIPDPAYQRAYLELIAAVNDFNEAKEALGFDTHAVVNPDASINFIETPKTAEINKAMHEIHDRIQRNANELVQNGQPLPPGVQIIAFVIE